LERSCATGNTQQYKRLMSNEVEAANDSCDDEDKNNDLTAQLEGAA
jgi:hypothetical protein